VPLRLSDEHTLPSDLFAHHQCVSSALWLGDHMQDLDTTQNDTRAAEVLEAEHWSDDAFDGPMVLLNDVVQILELTNLDRCVAFGVHSVQRGQIGSAFVDCRRLGCAVLLDRFFEITRGSLAHRRKSTVYLPCPRPGRGTSIHLGSSRRSRPSSSFCHLLVCNGGTPFQARAGA